MDYLHWRSLLARNRQRHENNRGRSLQNRNLKAYLHVRFQGTILHLYSSLQRIEIICLLSKPTSLMRNRTYV
jgi:hypothetical protein